MYNIYILIILVLKQISIFPIEIIRYIIEITYNNPLILSLGRNTTVIYNKYFTIYGKSLLNQFTKDSIEYMNLLENIDKIWTGTDFMFISAKDELYTIGNNSFNLPGLNSQLVEPTKVNIPDIKSISFSSNHIIFVTKLGKVFGCASKIEGRLYGQIGKYYANNNKNLNMINIKDFIVSSSCGLYHTLLLSSSGKIYSSGSNEYGQLGLGDQRSAILEQVNLNNNVAISCGDLFSVSLLNNGDVYFWGSDASGEILFPKRINISNIYSIACGKDNIMALSTSGEVYMWWRSLNCNNTVPFKMGLKNIIQIVNGGNHYCAVSWNHDIYIWGRDDFKNQKHIHLDQHLPQLLYL